MFRKVTSEKDIETVYYEEEKIWRGYNSRLDICEEAWTEKDAVKDVKSQARKKLFYYLRAPFVMLAFGIANLIFGNIFYGVLFFGMMIPACITSYQKIREMTEDDYKANETFSKIEYYLTYGLIAVYVFYLYSGIGSDIFRDIMGR